MSSTTYTVTAAADKAGSRLDRLLAEALPELSRTRLKALIEEGRVTDTQGRPVADPNQRVRAGQSFAVSVPQPPPMVAHPQAIPLKIVHEDEHLIVIDKPAGLVVHPGAGNPDGTVVNGLLAHVAGGLSSIGAPLRPGIVHRLDKDTSGLLVVAKTDAAHIDLARQFAEHSIERAYYAVVWGNPKPPAGRIHHAIGRAHDRIRMTTLDRGGKSAVTFYKTEAVYGSMASLVRCRLATGRTHQIRVHMASIGHSVVGDPLYGGRGVPSGAAGPAKDTLRTFPRQALHAFLMGFRHPATRHENRFCSQIPNDIRWLMSLLEIV